MPDALSVLAPTSERAEDLALDQMQEVVNTLTAALTRYADARGTSRGASTHMEILIGQAHQRVEEIRHELRDKRLRARRDGLL